MSTEAEVPSSNPATTTVPSSEPPSDHVPASIPPPASPQRPKQNATILQKLRLVLLRSVYCLANSSDRNLVRISKLLTSFAATDSLLATVGYTLTFLHAVLSKLLESRLASIATNLAEKAEGVLFPGETLVATLPAPRSTKILAQTVGSSKAIADTIADYRIFVRMWGMAGIYTWARNTWQTPLPNNAPKKDKVLRSIVWGEILASVGFQILENGAYLSSKGALTSSSWIGDAGKKKEMRWWIWSSQFWAAQVSLELIRLYILWLNNGEEDAGTTIDHDGEKEGKIKKQAQEQQKKRQDTLWWRDLVNNVAYFPMTLHWSTETGLLSDAGVGLFGTFAGGSMLLDHWRATA